ncbi:MAG: hypothetical protein CMK89_02830 [Pseudomonadales bacterium]|nr:hypothetical protein [Pseudomonadales bacterium]
MGKGLPQGSEKELQTEFAAIQDGNGFRQRNAGQGKKQDLAGTEAKQTGSGRFEARWAVKPPFFVFVQRICSELIVKIIIGHNLPAV